MSTLSTPSLVLIAESEKPRPPPHFSLEDVLEALGTHRKQWLIILISAIAYAHFSVQTMMPTLATRSIWDTWPELESHPMVYNSVFACGAFARLIGALFLLPWIDVFGRLYFVFGCMALSVFTSCLSSSAPAFWVFVLFRSLTLLLTSVLPSASVVYSLEMVMTKRRSLPATLCQVVAILNCIFAIFMTGGFESSVRAGDSPAFAWKWAMIVSNAPAVIAIAGMAWLWLETPRFQAASKGDTDAAWVTFAKLTPHGSTVDLKQRLHLPEESPFPPTSEFEGIDSTKIPPPRGVIGHLQDILTFALSRTYRRTTWGLAALWILQTFAHWGMTSYIGVFYTSIGLNKTWTTAGTFLVQLPGNLVIYYLMQWKHGGRLQAIRIFALSSGLCLVLLAVSVSVSVMDSKGWLVFLSMMSYFFGSPIWGAIYALTAESYVTVNRGLAMAFFNCLAAVSTICTTYFSAATVSADKPWLYPSLWAVLRFMTFFAAFLPARETAHRALMDLNI